VHPHHLLYPRNLILFQFCRHGLHIP
jgi:hypothetical protein